MTYRERREARADRLDGWAAKRHVQAAAVLKAGEPFTTDYAFNTQPGHIPFRAKLIAREDRAVESMAKANRMSGRADGIRDQLDRSIYSDDPDAIEALEARIVKLEQQREDRKTRNAAYRKEHRDELKMMTPYQRSQAVPYPSYSLANLSGDISRNRKRLATLKASVVAL